MGILLASALLIVYGGIDDVRSNGVLGRDFLLGVYIDLDKRNVIRAGELRRELFVEGGNSLARSAPICIDFLRSAIAPEIPQDFVLDVKSAFVRVVGFGGVLTVCNYYP